MKKILVLTIALMATCLIGKAQCNGTTKWTSVKSKFIDSSGNVVNEREEAVTVQANNKTITVVASKDEDRMDGDVSDYVCNWKEPGKNGKTIIKSVLTEKNGKQRHATITIEGIDGKISILLQAEEEANKILLDISSYEEVKQ